MEGSREENLEKCTRENLLDVLKVLGAWFFSRDPFLSAQLWIPSTASTVASVLV